MSIGPSLFLSFIISGMIALPTALVYAELSARMPSSGSAYAYLYSSFGELSAWLMGWTMTLRYGGSAAGLARSWTEYLVKLMTFVGVAIPTWLYSLKV